MNPRVDFLDKEGLEAYVFLQELDETLSLITRQKGIVRINNLKSDRILFIEGIYSERFNITKPLIDKENSMGGDPRYVLYISLKKGESSHA